MSGDADPSSGIPQPRRLADSRGRTYRRQEDVRFLSASGPSSRGTPRWNGLMPAPPQPARFCAITSTSCAEQIAEVVRDVVYLAGLVVPPEHLGSQSIAISEIDEVVARSVRSEGDRVRWEAFP